MNIETFSVNFREHIERAVRFHAGDARNIVNQFPRAVTLLVQATARHDKFADALVAAERSLNGMLCRNVGAQAH
ncbi:hypothetical protein D3C71_1858320 [compost metagenome]